MKKPLHNRPPSYVNTFVPRPELPPNYSSQRAKVLWGRIVSCGGFPNPPSADYKSAAAYKAAPLFRHAAQWGRLLAGFFSVASLLAFTASAATPQLDTATLLKRIEEHYNHAKTLEVQFTEGYTVQGRARQPESGTLTLRKPGRMRWDYSQPAGKLFVSDGKNVWLYTPALKRVEKVPLTESEDMRAPLAFLLGKLDFLREFKDFTVRSDPSGGWLITAAARSDRLPYDKVEMTVSPSFVITDLKVTSLDQAVLSFAFSGEKVNTPVDNSVFHFVMPAGAILATEEAVVR